MTTGTNEITTDVASTALSPGGGDIISERRGAIISETRGGFIGIGNWKHMEEWIEALNGLDGGTLKGNALRTLQQIEAVTPWEDYTCANLLAVLLDGRALELSNLLPSIAEWRDNLINTPLVNSGG